MPAMYRAQIRALAPLALLAFAAALLAARAAAAQPMLSLQRDALVISGLTPSGQAVLFGATRVNRAYHQALTFYREVLADEDGDGVVRFEPWGEMPGGEVPWKSLWVAVDLATGEAVAAAPEGYPLHSQPLPAAALDLRPDRSRYALRLRQIWLELVVVRPGVGAWGGEVHDGGIRDDDGVSDDHAVADLTTLEPIEEGGPPLGALRQGDLLLVLAPHVMELSTYRLVGLPPAPATSY